MLTRQFCHLLAGVFMLTSLQFGCGSDAGSDRYPWYEFTSDATEPTAGGGLTTPTTTTVATGGWPTTTTGGQPSTTTGVAPTGGDGLPCPVEQIIQEHCSECHGTAPRFGAPMSLVTHADLVAPAVTDPSRPIYQLVVERVADTNRPMPPAPYERLSQSDSDILNAWVTNGAQASKEPCVIPDTPTTPRDEDPLGALPSGERCDVMLDLRANHAGSAFDVPQADDHYECFYFKVPGASLQLTGAAPLVDDERVLHHWLLYTTQNSELTDGSHEGCSGIHPSDTLITGWAPGGETVLLPEGVGLEVPSGQDAYFILEIHYNNVARYTDALDQSGARLCLTTTPQEHVAAVHWLGTENILLLPGESQAGSTCAPNLSGPVQLLSISPHMHQLGVHSSMVINRASGTQETLLDKPFDFNTQIGYKTPATLHPGDTLTTTCTWSNTSGAITFFGEGTNDEMCYLFTIAYPAGALNTGGDLLGVDALGGQNKCMR